MQRISSRTKLDTNMPGPAPLLLRRSSSINRSVGGEAGGSGLGGLPPLAPSAGSSIVDPNDIIPVEDADPDDSALSMSTHKRKTSGIPLDVEQIVNRSTEMEMSLGQIADSGDEEEGEHPLGGELVMDSMPEFDEMFCNEQGRGGSSRFFTASTSDFKNMFTSRRMSFLAVLAMLVTFFAFKQPPKAAEEVAATTMDRPMDSKGVQYGEEHMEVVGAPKEAHVHEYNKILFFDSPDKMKPMHSKGPVLFNSDIAGLYLFENVCLTNNVDALRYRPMETTLRGLIYFTDDKKMNDNSKRCVPCSNNQAMETWDETYADESIVGHKCGMNGLHAMYASSVGDWSSCIKQEENTQLMTQWGQTQSPTAVETIHFFKEPTFLLQFNALDMETSLFDMLMTYLPHWDQFRHEWDFPYEAVISHSLQGCLSHSHNWFCEVLHQMNAFGPAKEIPWEPDESTLYCFEELFYNQVGYQRELDHEGLVTRDILGDFREILFRKFALPRRRTVEDRKEEAAALSKGEEADDDTKIIFYDNKLSQLTKWNEMEALIEKARSLEKYQSIKFGTVDDFSRLTVAEQARTFNEADAIIMVHGEHMANAIFAVDGTKFVEVGCEVSSLIGNPRFMELFDGEYRAVEKCKGDEGTNVCVKCEGNGDGNSAFTMTPAAFEKMVDDVVKSLKG